MHEHTPPPQEKGAFPTRETQLEAFKTEVQRILHTLRFFEKVFANRPFIKSLEPSLIPFSQHPGEAVEKDVRKKLKTSISNAISAFVTYYNNACVGALPIDVEKDASTQARLNAIAKITEIAKEYFDVTEEEIAAEREKAQNKVVQFPTSSQESV